MNFIQFRARFQSEKDIIDHFINVRYNGTVRCNHCNHFKVHQRPTRLRIFQCNGCNKDFSIFKDTIFERSTTNLMSWFYTIHLFTNAKKGVSAAQIERELGVTYKTAWRMLKQIRTAMHVEDLKGLFDGIVEIDETYIGGKPKKKLRDSYGNNINKRGRGTAKTPVVGVKDREKQKVYARVALPNKQGKKLTGRQLLEVLSDVTKPGSTVMTDQFRSYNILKKHGFIHFKVDHRKEFVMGPIHTNGMESFWSTLKRGHYGMYHSMSLKYLQLYVDEFCFRYNNRNNPHMFDLILKQGIKKRI